MFIGETIGPTLGSLLNRWTGQLLSVFYGAVVAHLIYVVFVWTFLPQSLSLSLQTSCTRKIRKREKTRCEASWLLRCFEFLLFVKRLFSFLASLAAFVPTRETSNCTKRRRRDWNLTMIGLAYSTAYLIMVCFQSRRRGQCFQIASVGINELHIPICCCCLWLDFGNCKLSQFLPKLS